MANPLEQVIALAKKGDRRVLLIGAGAVGGGIGFVVYLKNRGKGDQSSPGGSSGGDLFGGGGGSGGGGSGGGGSGSVGGLGDLGLPAFDLPELPSVDLPTLDTPTLPDLPVLTGMEDTFQLPNFGGTNPLSLSDFPSLPDFSSMLGGMSLPSLPNLALPDLGPMSYAGDLYGNALGTVPELPAQSLAVQNLRAGATSVPESSPSDPFAALAAAARAAAQNQSPLQSFAASVQGLAQRTQEAITSGNLQAQASITPQVSQALQGAQLAAQQAFLTENRRATEAAIAANQQVQSTAQRLAQAISTGTQAQVQASLTQQQVGALQRAQQAVAQTFEQRFPDLARIAAQARAEQARREAVFQQQAQAYADSVRSMAERSAQAIRQGTVQTQTYYAPPVQAQQAIQSVGTALSSLGQSRTGSLSGIAAAAQAAAQAAQRNAETYRPTRGPY